MSYHVVSPREIEAQWQAAALRSFVVEVVDEVEVGGRSQPVAVKEQWHTARQRRSRQQQRACLLRLTAFADSAAACYCLPSSACSSKRTRHSLTQFSCAWQNSIRLPASTKVSVTGVEVGHRRQRRGG